MSRYTTTFAANASLTVLATIKRPRGIANEPIGIEIGGTFGSGTVTLFESISGGTVKNAVKDITGTAYSTTAADSFRYQIPGHNDGIGPDVILYGTLAGATNPAITVIVQDNQ